MIQLDEVLLKKASQGDEAAFVTLYQRYRDRIFRFVYRMLGSQEKAEDVTQDCFLYLIRQLNRFDPERASFSTYIYAIARNLAFKHLRQIEPSLSVSDFIEDIYSSSTIELEKLLSKEISTIVEQAISSLPINQREVLILAEYEELSLAQIASITETNLGIVKSRLYRARENLRKALTNYFMADTKTCLTGKI